MVHHSNILDGRPAFPIHSKSVMDWVGIYETQLIKLENTSPFQCQCRLNFYSSHDQKPQDEVSSVKCGSRLVSVLGTNAWGFP